MKPSEALLRLMTSPTSSAEAELLAVLGQLLDDTQRQIEDYVNLFDIDGCPPSLLPALAYTIGVKDEYPYLASYDDQRKFIKYMLEANRYKGLEYSLQLLLIGIFDLDAVQIHEMHRYTLMTYRRGNGWNGGTTFSPKGAWRKERYAEGLPVDARTFGPLYRPNSLLMTLNVPLGPGMVEIADRVRLARVLIEKYVPEVVNPYLLISGYTGSEILPLPKEKLSLDLEGARERVPLPVESLDQEATWEITEYAIIEAYNIPLVTNQNYIGTRAATWSPNHGLMLFSGSSQEYYVGDRVRITNPLTEASQ